MSKKLKEENQQLKKIIADTLWMARRYAHNRSTFAPSTVNEAIDLAAAYGIEIDPDVDMGMYADDGMLGKWNPETKNFEKG